MTKSLPLFASMPGMISECSQRAGFVRAPLAFFRVLNDHK
jgi:hypothetical protein